MSDKFHGNDGAYGVGSVRNKKSGRMERVRPDRLPLMRTRKTEMAYGMEWIWGRIFSLYGKYEPEGRLFPALVGKLKSDVDITLSSCRQNWDYLNVIDAAEALVALLERGKRDEIYNIASGTYRPLREYIEEAKKCLHSDSRVFYGDDPEPFVSLQPSVEKIWKDTGWRPKLSFSDGIKVYQG